VTRYTGNGAYGYSNSVYMALRESGAAAAELPEPGFIECLTTMPFGTLYLRVGRDLLVYFSSPLATPAALANPGTVTLPRALLTN